jgi:hypothetical protein
MSFNQNSGTAVPILINSSQVLVTGNAASANALTVRQFGAGNVFSASNASGTTALFVGANGNVGVGTTNPTVPLHVISTGTTINLSNTASQTLFNAQIGRLNFANGGSDASIASCVNVGGINNNTDLRFYTSLDFVNQNIERMRIDRLGNVGIGTTNPGYILEVSNSTATTSTSFLGLTNPFVFGFNTGLNIGSSIVYSSRWQGDGTSGVVEMCKIDGRKEQNANFGDSYLAFQTRYVTDRANGGAGTLTEKMRISGIGNVGIGTTNPSSLLHVQGGDIYASSNINGNAGNTTWRLQPQYVGSNPFPCNFRIANGWDPIAGTGQANYGAVGINLNSYQGGSQIEFYTSATNNAVPTERMRIRTDGNVGIGTNNPGTTLDVNGILTTRSDIYTTPAATTLYSNTFSFRFNDSTASATGNPLLKIDSSGRNSGSNQILQMGLDGTTFNKTSYLDTATSGVSAVVPLAFRISGSEKMRVHTDGNVGIGTNAPAYKLEVIGIGNMIAATNLQSTVTQILGTSTTIGFAGTKTNHNTYIVSNNGVGGNIVLNAAGTAFYPLTGSACDLGGASNRWSTIYAVNALNTSDRNLKENISDAPLGIDFVNALNPKTFTWKEYTQTVVNPVTDEPRTVTKPAGTRLQYGLIAQDVKDVLDKFGIDSKDFAGYVDSTVNEPDKPQVLYLNYIQFIPILIKSVKELSAENTTLKQSLASMESRLAALEARG